MMTIYELNRLCAKEAHETLDIITGVEKSICAEEGLKEMWAQTKNRVLIMFGNHNAMVKFIRDNADRFNKLNPKSYVRTVLPADLDTATNALKQVDNVLAEARRGEPIDLKALMTDSMTQAGLELKEDGKIYSDKFEYGNWGAGKGKTNIAKPLMFKKMVEEFGWDTRARSKANEFIQLVSKVDRGMVVNAIDNHYRDLTKAVASKQEKADVRTDKRVALNQIRNLLSVRNVLIKFYFDQLRRILDGANGDFNQSETATGGDLEASW